MKMKKHKYGNAGQVRDHYADGGKVSKKKKKKAKKPDPKMLGSGAAQKAGTILRDKRAQQMKDMGL